DAALAIEPDHLSLYALTLDDPSAEGLTGAAGDHLPTPPGARRWRERARAGQDDDRAAAQYRHATDRLAADGCHGYAVPNSARPASRRASEEGLASPPAADDRIRLTTRGRLLSNEVFARLL